MSDYMPVRERNYTRTLAKKRMRSMTATRAVRNPVCTVTENHRENQYDLVELKGGGRLTPYDTVYNVICHRKSSLPFPLRVHNIIEVSIHPAETKANTRTRFQTNEIVIMTSANAEPASHNITMTSNFWNWTNAGNQLIAMAVPSPPTIRRAEEASINI